MYTASFLPFNPQPHNRCARFNPGGTSMSNRQGHGHGERNTRYPVGRKEKDRMQYSSPFVTRPYRAPRPAMALWRASFSFRAWSHARPLPPDCASRRAFFSSCRVLAFSRGSITTSSSSAFLR